MVSGLPDNQLDIQYIFFMEIIEKYYNFKIELETESGIWKKIICFTNEKTLQALSKYGKMEAVEIEEEINYEISWVK